MNNIIATKDTSLLRYLLGSPVTSFEYYRQIRAAFPNGDEYKFFAEPIVLDGGHKIAWSSSYPGKAVSYAALSEEDKSMAQDMLNEAIARLLGAVDKFKDPKLVSIFNNCIEIPNLDSIYVVNSNGESHIVVTQWGFIQDIPGAERGLLVKFLNIKKVPMRFKVVYSDDMSAAPYEDIIFEVSGKPMSGRSDADGYIVLDKIKEEAVVKAYEPSDTERANPQTYTCYENGNYTIKVSPKGDMQVLIVDQFGNPHHSQTFSFEYNGNKVSGVSNADGIITIERILSGTQVSAYQQQADGVRMYENSFVFDRKANPYKIVINVAPPPPIPEPEKPKTSNMRIKVIDDKNNIVKNAKVVVKYLDKKEVLVTDDEGYVVVRDLPVGTKVEAWPK